LFERKKRNKIVIPNGDMEKNKTMTREETAKNEGKIKIKEFSERERERERKHCTNFISKRVRVRLRFRNAKNRFSKTMWCSYKALSDCVVNKIRCQIKCQLKDHLFDRREQIVNIIEFT
jgi:hypothetical protein